MPWISSVLKPLNPCSSQSVQEEFQMKKSMIETAYQVLTHAQASMPFISLWNEVARQMGYTASQADDNIAQFYTDLSMDHRFLNMPKNTWDLKSRHTYSENVKDMTALAIDEDGDDEDLAVENEDDESESPEENDE